jgi:hypothetical protein
MSERSSFEEVHSRLAFNTEAYGKAWTGEEEDTKFIVRPLLDEIDRLQKAGNALADAVSDIMSDDPESVLHTWVRNWYKNSVQ